MDSPLLPADTPTEEVHFRSSVAKKRRPSPARRPGRPPKRGWRGRFLSALVQTGSKVKAARRAGIARSTATEREHSDPAFANATAQAKRDAVIERLAELYRRRPTFRNELALLAVLRPAAFGGLVPERRPPRPRISEETGRRLLREMLQVREARGGRLETSPS